MAAQRSCFIKQGRPAVAFHTIVRRRTRCIPTSDQALCPVGISRGKAASKADSAPPMSHSSRALLGMYWLVQGQGCHVLRLPLYMTKRQLGALFCYLHIYFIPNFAPPTIVTVSSTSRKFIAILISLILSITYNLNTITWKEFIQTHLTRLSPLISFNIAKTHNFFCHFL